MLVDLPLVDRDAFRDTELDDRLAVHVELLRELFGRQVIRHRPFPLSRDKKARRTEVFARARSALVGLAAGINGPRLPKSSMSSEDTLGRRRSAIPRRRPQTGFSTSR